MIHWWGFVFVLFCVGWVVFTQVVHTGAFIHTKRLGHIDACAKRCHPKFSEHYRRKRPDYRKTGNTSGHTRTIRQPGIRTGRQQVSSASRAESTWSEVPGVCYLIHITRDESFANRKTATDGEFVQVCVWPCASVSMRLVLWSKQWNICFSTFDGIRLCVCVGGWAKERQTLTHKKRERQAWLTPSEHSWLLSKAPVTDFQRTLGTLH